MLIKSFYEENKPLIDKVSEKIIELYRNYEKINNARLIEKMPPEQVEELLNKQPAYYEKHVIYEIYQNGYDPRAGRTLAVYIPSHFDKDFILSSCQSLFGEFIERDKKGCKNSNYRDYREGVIDLVFKEGVDYKTTLNLIFSDYSPLQVADSPYYNDIAKYNKFLSKAPKGVIY